MKGFLSSLTRTRLAFLTFCLIFSFGRFSNQVFADGLIISEFMASNSETLQDEDGDSPDWIEICNPTATDVNLSNWCITDNTDSPGKWRFPSITISSGSYLVIFASGKDRKPVAGNLHTNFKLSASGENLALYQPDGTPVYSYGAGYPEQYQDISYGVYNDTLMYFSAPTPGSPNTGSEYLPPPVFSFPRGFYSNPLSVEIISDIANADIYYTTDGSTPSGVNGTFYTGPVTISSTTPLRAVVTKSGTPSSRVTTFSYIFPVDVINQPNDPAGYPAEWGEYVEFEGTAIADYEMDPEITSHDEYEDLLIPSLVSLPSLSIVTDIGYLFSHTFDPDEGGIYIYTGAPGDERGLGWERPVSCEYIFPDGSEPGFQVNCGIRIQGGHSRRPEKSPKHSFRLLFKSEYGPGKLDYPVFGPDAADDFNTLVLRSAYGNSWRHFSSIQRDRAQHIRDPWAKDTQLDMGHISAHNKFAHLYINGIYWGVYNISERIDRDFMESYYGGDEEEYDIIKDYGELADGNTDAWNYLWNKVNSASILNNTEYQKLLGKNPDGTPNASYDSYLDAVNLIDYMLLNFYGGNNDWDEHNWIAGRNRVNPGQGFQFYCWDTEKILEDNNENYVNENNDHRPSGIFQRLMDNEEFKLLFADRVNLLLNNNGTLTPDQVIDRWMLRADEIELAMVSESARWGDYRRDVHPWASAPYYLYTVNDHWLVEQERLVYDYFRERTDIVLGQLGFMLPGIGPPEFSQYGGLIDENFRLGMSVPHGTIFYNLNGSDPRLIGGDIAAGAQQYSGEINLGTHAHVMARAKLGPEWSALTHAYFYDENHYPGSITEITQGIENLLVYPNPFTLSTTIQYNLPAGGNVKLSVFSVDGKLVAAVNAGHQMPGRNSVTWTPDNLRFGMYLFRIECGIYSANGKLLYMQ